MNSTERVLLVDDDALLLEALRRNHRRQFEIECACGPEEGLKALESKGPFAVVVSDFQMPGMDGVQFLGHARERAPDTVRIMLTGNPGLQLAMDAVNSGRIFRFLTKPCDPEVFRAGVGAAIEQYRLQHAERLLLEQTLQGSIQVLADVLSLASPAAFGRARRVREYVRHVATRLHLPDAWQVETAALLSQIGCLSLPPDLLDRSARGEELSPTERELFDRHPTVASSLLAHIPRLEKVVAIVAHQRDGSAPGAPPLPEDVALAAAILRAALGFDERMVAGSPRTRAIERMQQEGVPARILAALCDVPVLEESAEVRVLKVDELRQGMVFDQALTNRKGAMLVQRGQEITLSLLERLRNLEQLGSLDQGTRVRVRLAPRPEGA